MTFLELMSIRPSSPLADAVSCVDIAVLRTITLASRSISIQTPTVIAAHIIYGAGDFLRNTLPQLELITGRRDRDIVALETLVYSAFSVRRAYGQTTLRDASRPITAAFNESFLACSEWTELKLNRGVATEFENRLAQYAAAYRSGGLETADSMFAGNLQAIPLQKGRSKKSSAPGTRTDVAARAIIAGFSEAVPREIVTRLVRNMDGPQKHTEDVKPLTVA